MSLAKKEKQPHTVWKRAHKLTWKVLKCIRVSVCVYVFVCVWVGMICHLTSHSANWAKITKTHSQSVEHMTPVSCQSHHGIGRNCTVSRAKPKHRSLRPTSLRWKNEYMATIPFLWGNWQLGPKTNLRSLMTMTKYLCALMNMTLTLQCFEYAFLHLDYWSLEPWPKTSTPTARINLSGRATRCWLWVSLMLAAKCTQLHWLWQWQKRRMTSDSFLTPFCVLWFFFIRNHSFCW